MSDDNIFLEDGSYEYIKISGVCYQRIRQQVGTTTHNSIDTVHASCQDCEDDVVLSTTTTPVLNSYRYTPCDYSTTTTTTSTTTTTTTTTGAGFDTSPVSEATKAVDDPQTDSILTVGGYWKVTNQDEFVTVQAMLNDSATNLFPAAEASFQNQAAITMLGRVAYEYDLATDGITATIAAIETMVTAAESFMLMYKPGPLETVNNPLYNMHTWTPLGEVTVAEASAVISDIPRSDGMFVGFMQLDDYNNTLAARTGVDIPESTGTLDTLWGYEP